MRKFLSLICATLFIFTACSKRPKTTVETQEEWAALFSADNYQNATLVCEYQPSGIIFTNEYTENMYHSSTIFQDSEATVDLGESYVMLMEDGSKIYVEFLDNEQTNFSEHPADEENWEEVIFNNLYFPFGENYVNDFENFTYNENDKCYVGEYPEHNLTVQVSVLEGKLEQVLITDITDGSTVTITASDFGTTKIDIPDYHIPVHTVANSNEWLALFDAETLNNFTVIESASTSPYAPIYSYEYMVDNDRYQLDTYVGDDYFDTSYVLYTDGHINSYKYHSGDDYWDMIEQKEVSDWHNLILSYTGIGSVIDKWSEMKFDEENQVYVYNVEDEMEIVVYITDGKLETISISGENPYYPDFYTNTGYTFFNYNDTHVTLPRVG